MRRFLMTLLCILVLCSAVFLFSVLPPNTSGSPAANGVLDITGIDFSSSIAKLEGEWEFYHGRLYTPSDLADALPDRELIAVPGAWTDQGYPMYGYATYRLTVLTGRKEALMLYLPEVMAAAEIWVNGRHVFQAGRVGNSSEMFQTANRNEFLTLSPVEGKIEMVIQVANYEQDGSGLFYPLYLGKSEVLLRRLFGQRMVLAATLGGILLIGLYHLILFGFRRREKIYLVFCAICVTAVIRLSIENNSLGSYFRLGGLNSLLNTTYLVLTAIHSILIAVFFLQTFQLRPSRVQRWIIRLSYVLPIGIAIMLPYRYSIYSTFLSLVPYFISLWLVFRRGMVGENPYRLLYLCSLIFFMIYAPVSKTVFEGTLFVPGSVSNLLMVLCQCVLLSQSYAAAHNEVERVNANLESLVEERTGELYHTNRMLAASQTALREMIANISHDLKTPLTVLSNYLEILNEGQAEDAIEQAEYLGIAYHKNLDLQRLVGNLFEVTRMESGEVDYRREWIAASALLEKAGEKYAALAHDRGVAFHTEIAEDFELYIDQEKIWSVLDNLVYNALRHTEQGGIAIAAQRRGECGILRVKDTGEGIAPKHLPHIFARFFKASRARAEKEGSSGIGLYIVKTATEGMGGTVEVESAVGLGTTFTLTFVGKEIPR